RVAGLTFRGVAIERGGVDTLQRRLYEAEADRGGNTQHHSRDDHGSIAVGHREQHDDEHHDAHMGNHEYGAETAVADDVLAPGFLEQSRALLDGFHRADVARNE